MRHKYYDAIMAWAEGEAIESHFIGSTEKWHEWSVADDKEATPEFNATHLEWRRKPKRFEWWENVFTHSGKEVVEGTRYETKEAAAASALGAFGYVRTIRMVEADE